MIWRLFVPNYSLATYSLRWVVQTKWQLKKNQIPWIAYCCFLDAWNRFYLTAMQKNSFSSLLKTVNDTDIISKDLNFNSSVLLKKIAIDEYNNCVLLKALWKIRFLYNWILHENVTSGHRNNMSWDLCILANSNINFQLKSLLYYIFQHHSFGLNAVKYLSFKKHYCSTCYLPPPHKDSRNTFCSEQFCRDGRVSFKNKNEEWSLQLVGFEAGNVKWWWAIENCVSFKQYTWI